jgi:putative SOS response-associated peptidase YedK
VGVGCERAYLAGVCNLYRLAKPLQEVSTLFRVRDGLSTANLSEEVYPGYPGVVVTEQRLQRMTWGFPLQLRGKQGNLLKPKPVNNARTDKLGSSFWHASFEKRRCLIPLTAWAEAEGPKGHKTRTWLILRDQPIFACAGVWRPSEEWGDVYSMVMTDACGEAAQCHTRMPVILEPHDWEQWLAGSQSEALGLCLPYAGNVVLDRTLQPWAAGRSVPASANASTGRLMP